MGQGMGSLRIQPVFVRMAKHTLLDFNNYRVQVLTRDGVPTLEFGDNDLEKLHYPIGCVYY